MKEYLETGILFLTLLLLASCKDKTGSGENTINPSWKDNAKTLVLEEIPTGNLLEYAQDCYVFGNIMVVENHKNSDRYLLDFVDMKTMKVLKSTLRIGRGPGEVQFCIIRNSGNHLIIDSSMDDKIAKIDVADFVKDNNAKIEYKDYNFSCEGLDIWDDNRFIVVNPYKYINKDLKIDQDGPRFLLLEGTDHLESNGLITAIEPNAGSILINEKTHRVCYVSHDIPLVEIYDHDLNLKKALTGPDDMNPKYYLIYDYVRYQTDIPTSYSVTCFDNSYMYLAYEGRILNAMEIIMNGGKIENSDTWIFKLDWDGNVKDSYFVGKDKKIKSMSTGKDGELYLCCEVEGIIKLFKTQTEKTR